MTDRITLKKHAHLFDEMAQTLGVDLEAALIEGRAGFDTDTLGEAVLRCTGCSDPGHCAGWLARPEAQGAEAAPGYCSNGALLDALRAAVQ